ncbi:protein eva-1 homolog A isoform X2 [Anas platyrhynchos]|uniref:protein eva-1 homolog A isoform X2 n=1 Tax=Anas platyrhynchos TaxID=8839 RepID=UPI00065E40D6|nr:protein eva-1 homolog A isoform X2 [Anas platyrhynchos]|eukprot:XP_012948855.1 protein eva-1 homolog A isoform X2 [Anas platyrhynchos]
MCCPDVFPTSAFLMGLMCLTACSNFARTSADFSGYISQVLKNYTDHACDGEYISLRCPHRTTISIQSSFYGRIVPSHQMCPSRYPHSYATLIKEDVDCSVGTSLQKMLDECQDRRSCQFLVNSRLFGADPCPGTGKYLLVWYKCRPNEYKSKVACEDDKLRLSCKKSMVIAIYSAVFGRTQGGSLECPYQNLGMPMIDCQSATALQLMIKRCHGKRSCSIYASTYEFGDPCYPGIRKHLNVIYTCVPRKLLHETQPGPTNYQGFQKPHFPLRPRVFDPNVIGDGVFLSDVSPSNIGRALPEKKKGRSATFYPLDNTPFLLPVDETQPPVLTSSMEPVGVSTEMALLSNILAAYAFITENPERAALYFVSGVCIGLVLTLLALVLRVSCRTDCKRSSAKKPPRERESDSDSSDSDDDSDTTSDLSARRHRRFERTLNMNVFTSAEELERAQRLEERERIIREIWMNGQPDIPGTRSLNRYY